jgi:Mg-chelatase subunit ChlD/capsular polysaccharide biosynthesis protein
MNDEPPTSFDTVGDAPLEARIVAWVLGEASNFEAAELERLCEERPELLIFRHRMRALHGLLTEAEAAEPDLSWKLSPEKRKILDEIFGEDKSTPIPSKNKSHIHYGRRALLAIAACLVISLVVFQLIPIKYEAQAIIEVKPPNLGLSPFGGTQSANPLTPQFFGTEFDKIKSIKSLEKVVTNLDLPQRWNVDKQSAIKRLKNSIKTENLRGTDLISVRVSDANEQDANDITNEIVHNYKAYRTEIENQDADRALRELNKAVQDQEDKVEERRKLLATIVRTKGIIYKGQDSFYGQSGVDESSEVMKGSSREEAIKRGLDAQDYVDAKRDFETDQQLLQKLRLKQVEARIAKATTDDSIVIHEEPARTRSSGRSDQILAVSKPKPASPLPPGQYSVEPKPHAVEMGSVQAKEQTQIAKQSAQRQIEAGASLAPSSTPPPQIAAGSSITPMEPIVGSNLTGKTFNPGPIVEAEDSLNKRDTSINSIPQTRNPKIEEAASPRKVGKYAEAGRLIGGVLASGLQNTDAKREMAMMDDPVRDFSVPLDAKGKPTEPEPLQEPILAGEAEPLIDLIEEVPTSETPYSTFSLNISDASFQLAKAALAKGERPDPSNIKPEQFYNAVDYGDPAPTLGEPVAATIEQSAHPVIPARNLVRVALRTASVGRSAIQPLRLTLLVDQSGSMVREDRRASMEHALSQLGILLTRNDLVTVIGFSRTSRLLADGMTGDQATQLGNLVNQSASEGGTNLEEAMILGGQLAERHYLAEAQNRIVLFTDGAANLGDADPARLAVQVKTFRQKGLAFDIAGIGADDLNDRLLSELARNGNGRYYVVGAEKNDSFARQLAGAFRPAAENVKVQVNFNPQRVKNYKLIGFEKDRLKTEDFRNDAVDAAELAVAEAGIAIYQVEPIAEGNGELGEVSVRFRDTDSSEMVERTWTMHYDSATPAFDRATPSMQLAGLSLLAAEKLRGGPLGAAIDFKQFTESITKVKESYGSSIRVQEMLQVIDSLR